MRTAVRVMGMVAGFAAGLCAGTGNWLAAGCFMITFFAGLAALITMEDD